MSSHGRVNLSDTYWYVPAEYLALHDWFGRGGNDVMHRLKARRRAVRSAPAVHADAAAEVEAPALEGTAATGAAR